MDWILVRLPRLAGGLFLVIVAFTFATEARSQPLGGSPIGTVPAKLAYVIEWLYVGNNRWFDDQLEPCRFAADHYNNSGGTNKYYNVRGGYFPSWPGSQKWGCMWDIHNTQYNQWTYDSFSNKYTPYL